METAAATDSGRQACAHCGLPIALAGIPHQDDIFCCRACRLVALIVGKDLPQGEQNWNLLRLGFGTLLAMNIMMISLLLYTGGVEAETIPLFRLVLLGLATPALLIMLPSFLRGVRPGPSGRRMSLDALIACGSLSAYLVSAVNVLRGSGAIYFDTATMLPVLVTFGQIIESTAKTRAADLLHGLESLLPAAALRVTPAGTSEVAIETLRPGDLIRVRPGERIAVDGNILEGSSSIEEAAFTGEFLPRLCQPGDQVIAGTVNGSGSLLVQAERTGPGLLLHGIVSLIGDAWLNPSQAERVAERAARIFLPVLLMVALGALTCWALRGNPGQGLLSALSVLVVACPCSIGIATPLATSLAIARAARAGIIVRGGRAMEQIAATDLVFFDKTGTLTVGEPKLQGIEIVDPGVGSGELLGRLAALESASGHLLGKAVVAAALRDGCEPGSVSEVRVLPGSGISGAVTWRGTTKRVVAGSEVFLDAEGGPPSPAANDAGTSAFLAAGTGSLSGDGTSAEVHPDLGTGAEGNSTIIAVAWEGKLRGRVLWSDALRPDAGRCVTALADSGISSVLLSGDRLPAALSVAGGTGISHVKAPCSPTQKLLAITKSIAAGHFVAMVGDGINDAPALAAAQTGIAFGAGTDLARQAGNVVILSGRLMQVYWLIGLSRKTGNVIRGNFAWSFGYNLVALGAAAAGLLHPLLAALAMVVSSLTVLGNSLRISGYLDAELESSADDTHPPLQGEDPRLRFDSAQRTAGPSAESKPPPGLGRRGLGEDGSGWG